MEEKLKAFTGMLEQSEVSYVPLSATKGKACANCRWFLNGGCFIVESYEPEPILATGYCNRWEATPAPVEPEPVSPIPVVIVESGDIPPMDDMEKALEKPGVIDRIWKAIQVRLNPSDDGAFSVFKGSDGKDYWHAVYSNDFEDREQEILTRKAHDKFITRVDMGLVPMPELWSWHTPGTRHGQADVLWRSGHFTHAIGHFDDTPLAQKAIAFYRKNAKKHKVSHGFTAPEWAFKDGHYLDYNTFEISPLPAHVAANSYTSFEEIKSMAMSDEKRRYIEEVYGKDKLADLEAKDEERGKALEAMKVAHKDFADATGEQPATNPAAEKALPALYLELVGEASELVTLMQAQSKELSARKDEIAALKAQISSDKTAFQKDIDALKALVNAPIVRPSAAPATVISETEMQTIKDKTPVGNYEAIQAAKSLFGNAIKDVQ